MSAKPVYDLIQTRTVAGKVVLQLLTTVLVLPFIFVLYASLSQSSQGVGFIANIRAVFNFGGIYRFFLNSIGITLGTLTLTYIAAMTAAYAFVRIRPRGGEVVYVGIVAAMTVPSIVLAVPLFVTMQRIGLFDTLWSVIIPLSALTIPLNVLLARTFMAGLSVEIFEAAALDGASHGRIFYHIVLPLSRPVGAVITIWTFLTAWNEYLLPLLFLVNPEKETVTLLPTYFINQHSSDYTKIAAASIIILTPTVIVYALFQKQLEKGVLGSV